MPRFHTYDPMRDFTQEKIEKLTDENLFHIKRNLEIHDPHQLRRDSKIDEQMAIYKTISKMPDPIFVYLHQSNMGELFYLAIFKGLFWGKKGLCLVLQCDEEYVKPYKLVSPCHIGKIKVVPYGKLVNWLNFEKDTKWSLWKDRCQHHPRSVEDPEWPGLTEV
jgi:hypothetical protein